MAAEMARCREAADAAAIRAGRAEAAEANAAGRLRDAEDLARRHAALQVHGVELLPVRDRHAACRCSLLTFASR